MEADLALRFAHWRFPLIVSLGSLCFFGAGPVTSAETPTKPAMTVMLERGEILAGQTIGMHVWIENPTDSDATDIRFRYTGPSFLHLGMLNPDKTCRTNANLTAGQGAEPRDTIEGDGAIFLGSIPRRAVLEPPSHLCLRADSNVEEQDLSLGFSLTYTLTKDGQRTSGFLLAEKKLSVGLFGTGSVGGVSLRLAAYVVPGLLLMMILRLGGVAWVKDLAATEVATLSVIVSVVLFLLASQLSRFNTTFAGVGSTVSAALFLVMCAAAVGLSGLTVLVRHWIKSCQASKAKALLIETTDNAPAVFAKALRGAGADLRPVTVITRNQERWVGSLMAPTSNGGIALVGWFQLKLKTGDPARDELKPMIDGNRFLEALEHADKLGLKPEMQNPVRKLEADGSLQLTTDLVRRFLAREILESSNGDVEGLETERPLVLGTP